MLPVIRAKREHAGKSRRSHRLRSLLFSAAILAPFKEAAAAAASSKGESEQILEITEFLLGSSVKSTSPQFKQLVMVT